MHLIFCYSHDTVLKIWNNIPIDRQNKETIKVSSFITRNKISFISRKMYK